MTFKTRQEHAQKKKLKFIAIYEIEKSIFLGGLAQLARAPALHAGGQRFESVILHSKSEIRLTSEKEHIDMKEAR